MVPNAAAVRSWISQSRSASSGISSVSASLRPEPAIWSIAARRLSISFARKSAALSGPCAAASAAKASEVSVANETYDEGVGQFILRRRRAASPR
jgi:hypothetical protein